MQRKFRIMDDDGSKALSMTEFKKAMNEMALNLSDKQVRQLFDYFDSDSNGSIDFEEFIQGVRDDLSARRKSLVLQAYNILDKDGNGIVDASDIAGRFDASNHPDVLAGSRSPEEIYREFLDTFDVGGVVDGKVTKEEFTNYYHNLSASIDNDDYFELMIRNAWHISGGEGWAANTANKRVLITLPDGTQAVEEIKDDLGLGADDRSGMIDRIAKQNQSLSSTEFKVSLFGSAGDSNLPPPRPPPSRRPHKTYASQITFG
jgi:Ca2+-binding EF-hand superfamily protein